jgi:predicted transcriptional regulator
VSKSGGEQIERGKLTKLMEEIGIKKTPSAILSAIICHEKLSLADLIRMTGLTKGCVASGLQHWHHKGWIKSVEGDSGGKGRAAHVWNLAFSQEEAFHRIATQIVEKKLILQKTIRSIERLIE